MFIPQFWFAAEHAKRRINFSRHPCAGAGFSDRPRRLLDCQNRRNAKIGGYFQGAVAPECFAAQATTVS